MTSPDADLGEAHAAFHRCAAADARFWAEAGSWADAEPEAGPGPEPEAEL